MKYVINGLIIIALVSILTFFFDFLEAEPGLSFYLAICATFLIVYFYRKHHGKIQ